MPKAKATTVETFNITDATSIGIDTNSMPKVKATTNAGTIVIDAATITPTKYTPTETINSTPPEGQYITTESFADEQPTSKQPHTLEEKIKTIKEIKANREANRDRLLVAKDIVKSLEANQKELDQQYVDALKHVPEEYKSILQKTFNF